MFSRPITSILVLGGGSAGLLAALTLRRRFPALARAPAPAARRRARGKLVAPPLYFRRRAIRPRAATSGGSEGRRRAERSWKTDERSVSSCSERRIFQRESGLWRDSCVAATAASMPPRSTLPSIFRQRFFTLFPKLRLAWKRLRGRGYERLKRRSTAPDGGETASRRPERSHSASPTLGTSWKMAKSDRAGCGMGSARALACCFRRPRRKP